MEWKKVDQVPPIALSDARLLLHYGALVLGSTASAFIAHAEDHSHSNLGLFGEALRTHPLDQKGRVSLELNMRTLSLCVRDEDAMVCEVRLEGMTLLQSLAWAEGQLSHLCDGKAKVAKLEFEGFPDHPLAHGAVFGAPMTTELDVLAHWFGNGLRLIETLRLDHPKMSSPRVWPHHLDLGVLIPVGDGDERSIGVGLSPGDDDYDQPYFYCSPYPAPDGKEERSLPVGHWHTQGFYSAIVTAEELLASPTSSAAAQSYLHSAMDANLKSVS